jgi:predicted SnoaL-like aldol condensation-catalyzing enzyme
MNMLEKNKELVRRFYEVSTTPGCPGMGDIVTADYYDHHFLPSLPKGPEGVRMWNEDVLASVFSDISIDIDFMVAEGNKVDCHFALVGKHTGAWGDLQPKGNAMRIPCISTFRIQDGKIAEGWELFDSGDMLNQMKA